MDISPVAISDCGFFSDPNSKASQLLMKIFVEFIPPGAASPDEHNLVSNSK